MAKPFSWSQCTALYQIYPRSFYDSNGDGVGDLKGIIKKLDYLKGGPHSLGVDAIWLSPFYSSPMADFGYDVADYCDVDPLFGTLKDFDELIRHAHARDLKVLIDFVPNHTSDKHPWFEESRASKHNPKRDWYIWRDPAPDGSAPNNWLSAFSGSAWQLDEQTGQYYLHSFLPEQPDLNWHNPEVREAMQQVVRFWLERDVDGFRVDAVYWLAKDVHFRNDPASGNAPADTYDSLTHTYSRGRVQMFAYLRELAEVVKEHSGRLLITEAYPDKRADYEEYLDFYTKVDPEVLAPFNFETMYLPWSAQAFKRSIDDFQGLLHTNYLPVYAFSNHDAVRIASRWGEEHAAIVAMLLLSLPGLPVIYYGEEIGMKDVAIPKNRQQDGRGHVVKGRRIRDPSRTPMQWIDGKGAGFSAGVPWLPLGDFKTTNVRHQQHTVGSLWRLYQELLAFRRTSKALQNGEYLPIATDNPDLFAFLRKKDDETVGIALNFSDKNEAKMPFKGEVVASTKDTKTTDVLVPLEGRIIRVVE